MPADNGFSCDAWHSRATSVCLLVKLPWFAGGMSQKLRNFVTI